MLKTKIYHTVNAGLYIQSARAKLLVDGLHKGLDAGCSLTPERIVDQAMGGTGLFFDLSALAFTHLHEDHFDPGLTAHVLALPCAPRLIGAVRDASGAFSLEEGPCRCSLEDMEITTLPSVHEAEMFRDFPHHSLFVRTPDASLFLAGDAILTDQLAEQVNALSGGRLQAVFLNPMQLLADGGKEFLRRVPAEKAFIYHLPFPEDDVFLYGQTARHTVKACLADFPHLRIPEPMQWVDLF